MIIWEVSLLITSHFFCHVITQKCNPNSQKKMERFNQFLMEKKDFESQNFAIFDKVGHNFGKSDEDMI